MNIHYIVTLPHFRIIQGQVLFSRLSKRGNYITRPFTQTKIKQSKGGFECVLARLEVQYFYSLEIQKGEFPTRISTPHTFI